MKTVRAVLIVDRLSRRTRAGRLPGFFGASHLSQVLDLLPVCGITSAVAIDLNQDAQALRLLKDNPIIDRILPSTSLDEALKLTGTTPWVLWDPAPLESMILLPAQGRTDAILWQNSKGDWAGWLKQANPGGRVEPRIDLEDGILTLSIDGVRTVSSTAPAFSLDPAPRTRLSMLGQLLAAEASEHFPPSWTMAGEQVYVGRGTRIHPTAILEGPVFIGDFVTVAAGARLSAGSIVLPHSRVGAGALLENVLVEPHTWVRDRTYLRDAVVDGGTVWSRQGSEGRVSAQIPGERLMNRGGAQHAGKVQLRLVSSTQTVRRVA